MMNTKEIDITKIRIYEALYEVYDPELGVNVVDLGLIYGVEVNEARHATITMTLTTPGCPIHESIGEGVDAALQHVPGITGSEVHLVWEPAWEPERMMEEGEAPAGLLSQEYLFFTFLFLSQQI